jgi:hypothetical protein
VTAAACVTQDGAQNAPRANTEKKKEEKEEKKT